MQISDPTGRVGGERCSHVYEIDPTHGCVRIPHEKGDTLGGKSPFWLHIFDILKVFDLCIITEPVVSVSLLANTNISTVLWLLGIIIPRYLDL